MSYKMGVFVRSPSRFSNIVLLVVFLLQCVLTRGNAHVQHVHETTSELRGSMARYQHLIEQDNSLRNLLQVEDKKVEEQGDIELASKDLDIKHVEDFQAEQEVVVHSDVKGGELKERNTEGDSHGSPKLDPEKTEQKKLQVGSEKEQVRLEKGVEPKYESKVQSQGVSEKVVEAESKTAEQHMEGEEKTVVEPQPKTAEKQKLGVNEKMVEPESKSEEEQQEGKGEKLKAEEDVEEPFEYPEPHILGPTIKDWDEQRRGWLEANPHMKLSPEGKPRILLVTGSQPGPCKSPVGDNFHIKSLKLKIDYARLHKYEIYYNFVWLDPLLGSMWVKLPTIRALMLTHPEIEWFFWMDSDAVFTDMLFEPPLDTFEGYNMVMWGWEYGLYTEKSWVAYNNGVFFIRNCQWSLDLIDKWSPMGQAGPVRVQYGKFFSSYLANRRPNYPADDQSALAYLLINDQSVKEKVKLVDSRSYMFSGFWLDVVDSYENCMEKYHPGLGDYRWPWVTHFTGCGPCAGGDNPDYSYKKCMDDFDRAFNFADNQVLAYVGYEHVSLSSPAVVRTRNETDRPLEFLDVNPWEKRIAEVAAAAAAEGASA